MSKKQDRPRTRSVTSSERKKARLYESDDTDCKRGSISSEWPKDWDKEETQFENYIAYHRIADELAWSVDPRSSRYTNGWSPFCNGTREAFFSNYASEHLCWSKLWPNTRIPSHYRTPVTELEGCVVITVDLESECVNESSRESSVVSQPVKRAITASSEVSSNIIIEEENPGNTHNRAYYNDFNELLNRDDEGALQYQRSLDQQVLDRDRWFQLNYSYYQYVNRKGKRLMRVTLKGIDKCSKKYFPNRKQKGFYNSSYCIKTIGNTFVNHILGTVGFTVAEYYGQDFVNTKHTSYNIVQVVHGVSFTKSQPQLSRWKYSYKDRKNLPGKAFRAVQYYSPRNIIGRHTLCPVLHVNTFHIVQAVREYPITRNYYKSIQDIYNINAVSHDGVPARVPNEQSYTYDIDKKKYRIYCMYLSSLKPKNTFSVFKYIYPVPLDKIIKDNIIIPIFPVFPEVPVEVVEVPEIPLRPVNIRDHHQQKLRYWQFKQYILWTKIGDLQNTTEDQLQTLYPTFYTDFYNVKFMLTRK